MPKRGNDNAQMSKEEYEATQSRQGGGGSDADAGFQRAPESVTKGRRILKARRPQSASKAGLDEQKTGAFAGFSFAAPAPATTVKAPAPGGFLGASASSPAPAFSLGSTTEFKMTATDTNKPFPSSTPTTNSSSLFSATPGAASSTTGTPGFSFTNNNNNNNSATATPAATPAFLFGQTPAPASAANKGLLEEYQGYATQLLGDFQGEMKKYPADTMDVLDVVEHYLDAEFELEKRYYEKSQLAAGSSSNNFPPSASAGTTSSGFGGFATSAVKSPGAASVGASPFGASSFQVTPSTGVGFTFGGATPSAPVTAPSADNANPDEEAKDPTETVAQGDADKEWTVLKEIEGRVKFRKFVDKQWVTMTEGTTLKAQENKENGTRRLIMRNAATGKVDLNLPIAKGIAPKYEKTTHKKFPAGLEAVTFQSLLEAGKPAVSIMIRRGFAEPSLDDIMKDLANF